MEMSVHSGGAETVMPQIFTIRNFSPEQIKTLADLYVKAGRIKASDNKTEALIEELGGAEYLAETVDEAFEKAEEAARDVATALGDGILFVVRNIGVAVLEAIELTAVAILEAFEGRELPIIIAATVLAITVACIFVLLHEFRTGPAGAGEYMAFNRPSPGDGILGP